MPASPPRLACGRRVVTRPEDLKGAWHAAFTADRPMVLDVFTDPDFPTIPPHTTFQQAKDTAKALLAGDPDAAGRDPGRAGREAARDPAEPVTRHGVALAAEASGRSYLQDVRSGRFERSLAGLAAAGALITTGEVFLSHDGASFGNKMMWLPVAVVPLSSRPGSPRCSVGGRRRRCCRWPRPWWC